MQVLTNVKDIVQVTEGKIANDAKTMVAPFIPTVAAEAHSGAGALSVATYYTAVTTTAADALTLADGTKQGQLKLIKMVVDGGDGTLTPANLNGYATIKFEDAGDYVLLIWNDTEWYILENFSCVLA